MVACSTGAYFDDSAVFVSVFDYFVYIAALTLHIVCSVHIRSIIWIDLSCYIMLTRRMRSALD